MTLTPDSAARAALLILSICGALLTQGCAFAPIRGHGYGAPVPNDHAFEINAIGGAGVTPAADVIPGGGLSFGGPVGRNVRLEGGFDLAGIPGGKLSQDIDAPFWVMTFFGGRATIDGGVGTVGPPTIDVEFGGGVSFLTFPLDEEDTGGIAFPLVFGQPGLYTGFGIGKHLAPGFAPFGRIRVQLDLPILAVGSIWFETWGGVEFGPPSGSFSAYVSGGFVAARLFGPTDALEDNPFGGIGAPTAARLEAGFNFRFGRGPLQKGE